jgi:putative spermidine/putrescine transport system permease protein
MRQTNKRFTTSWTETAAHIGYRSIVVAVYAFLVGPFAVVLLSSFSSTASLKFPPDGLSLRWYRRFLDHLFGAPGTKSGLADALLTSASIATSAVALTLVTGVLAAYVLTRARWRARHVLRQVLVMPIIFPQIVIAIGMLIFFSEWQVLTPVQRLAVGHAVICFPFVLTIVAASFEQNDVTLEEAALGLGAGPIKTFFMVTLPLVRPALVASGAFAFIVSFTNFTISFFLTAEGVKTLPLWVYEVIEFYLDPLLAVLSVFLIFMTAATALLVEKVVGVGRIIRG